MVESLEVRWRDEGHGSWVVEAEMSSKDRREGCSRELRVKFHVTRRVVREWFFSSYV